jgi:hypothetical protein
LTYRTLSYIFGWESSAMPGRLVVPRRATAWVLGLLAGGCGVVVASASCSSTPPPTELAAGCSINSDCSGKLICAFGSCHNQCTTSKDCTGATCLPQIGGDVCELAQEIKCSGTLPCVVGLTCANDICRAPCSPGVGSGEPGACLKGQACVPVKGSSSQSVCVDEVSDGGRGDASSADAGRSDAHRDSSGDDSSGDDASGDDSSDHDSSGDDASDDGEPPEAGCALPEAGASPLGFTPSNFDPLHLTSPDGGAISIDAGLDGGGIDWSAAPDVVIKSACSSIDGTLTACLGVSPVTITLPIGSGNPPACYPNCVADLYVMKSLQIESGGSINVYVDYNAAAQTNPIILAVRTFAQIAGPFIVSGGPASISNNSPIAGANPGPGGFPVNENILGPGGGGNGMMWNNTPGGAGFCGSGGAGVAGSGTPAPPGQPYGLPSIVPLQAGSSGGIGDISGAAEPGGGGGGGLQISAGTRIVVTNKGILNANGSGAFGGGGSGGAILLEAPTVVIDGVLVANGGSGGYDEADPSGIRPVPGAIGNVNDTPALGAGAAGGNGSAAKTVRGSDGLVGDSGVAGTTWVGSGGGGAGWIRINTGASCSLTTTLDSGFTFISPSLGSGCASTGKIKY